MMLTRATVSSEGLSGLEVPLPEVDPQSLPMWISPQGCWGVLIIWQLASLPASDLREQGRGCHVFNELRKS